MACGLQDSLHPGGAGSGGKHLVLEIPAMGKGAPFRFAVPVSHRAADARPRHRGRLRTQLTPRTPDAARRGGEGIDKGARGGIEC
jgi:hypothetical protein